MSKMGISTLRSYRGAQVFEAIGLAPDLIEHYFNGTASRIGGSGLETLAKEAGVRWQRAFTPRQDVAPLLSSGGLYTVRLGGEGHLWSAEAVALLQQAVREVRYYLFRQYASQINTRARVPFTLRSLFAFQPT